jgi:thiamine biosynthesis lipoprotein
VRARHAWLLLLCLSLCLWGLGCAEPEPVELRGPTMGTTWSVKVAELPAGVTSDALHADLDGILRRINALMSTWDQNSELSRFNASATTDWFPVSDETVTVVDEAIAVARLTDGAFDVTVGPLVDLWGFGPEPRPDEPPSGEQIAAARERVGYGRLHTRSAEPALRKDQSDLRVDLSAIAKGYAVDQLAEHLESREVGDYMVEIGGEVRVLGEHPSGRPWRIGIERPITEGRAVQRVLDLEDGGLATSGDYRNFIERDGKRLSHTIDPRTGRPVEHGLASVTVLADSSMSADALATGLMVLGPEKAKALAEREEIEVLLIVRTEDGFREQTTPGFDAAVSGGAP